MNKEKSAHPWDDGMKRLVGANPQDFVTWVLKDAIFQQFLSVEFKNETVEADMLLEALLYDERIGIHYEFQSSDDSTMVQRMQEYNQRAMRKHGCPIWSCVIYLRGGASIPPSPLENRLPRGRLVHQFHYDVIRVPELTPDELVQIGLRGLLPLLPLTKGGKEQVVVERMINEILPTKQIELLSLGELFAGLVFTEAAERIWLKGRFAMYKDILRESWVFQEILQEGSNQTRQIWIQQQRELLVAIVQNRFPQLTGTVTKQAEQIADPEVLKEAILAASIEQNTEAFLAKLQALKGRTQ